jgi:cytochrome c553
VRLASAAARLISPKEKQELGVRGLTISLVALFAWSAGAEAAGDAALGKKVMLKCQVCHGKDGIAKVPDAPNIAGQKEAYLVKALMAFKAGERKNEQMTVVLKGLSEADIANVAAYYSSIKITVQVPP